MLMDCKRNNDTTCNRGDYRFRLVPARRGGFFTNGLMRIAPFAIIIRQSVSVKTGRTLTASSSRYTANVIKFSIIFAARATCETKEILAERSSSSNGVPQGRG